MEEQKVKQKKLTDDDFFEKYTTMDNPFTEGGSYDNKWFETYGEEYGVIQKAAETKPGTVWTVIDNNDGWFGIVAGWHYINRMGYFLTEEEYEDINEEYEID